MYFLVRYTFFTKNVNNQEIFPNLLFRLISRIFNLISKVKVTYIRYQSNEKAPAVGAGAIFRYTYVTGFIFYYSAMYG